ncbi:MAG: TlpA disulfide reductase family protein [Pseudohongiella sp.]
MITVAGPFALSVERLLVLAGFAIALLAGWLLTRHRRIRLEPTLTGMLVLGFISARLAFVLLYLEDYLIEPLSIIDIRDGGFDFVAGIAAAALFGMYRGWKHPGMRKPLALAVLSGAAVWGGGTLSISRTEPPRPALPPIALSSLTGAEVNLQSLNDRPMVVNLWATWCLPCRREMPVLEAAQQRDSGVNYVFINQAESADRIMDYLADEGLTLNNVLLDASAVSARLLDTRGLPSTYFFDADGNMTDAHVGELSRATLSQQLRKLR